MAKEAKKENKEKKGNFIKEFKAELKRVSWPTFKQLVNNTSAVLAIVLLTAVIVFILDVIFENLNNYGVEKIKALVTSNKTEVVLNEDDAQIESEETLDAENVTVQEESNTTESENTVE